MTVRLFTYPSCPYCRKVREAFEDMGIEYDEVNAERGTDGSDELGTLKDTEIHSASGSDSSLLTVLATTGILGFIPFITVYALISRSAWANRKNSASLGLLAGLSGLFVHSIFVNSLLFPLLLAPLWIVIGALSFRGRVS